MQKEYMQHILFIFILFAAISLPLLSYISSYPPEEKILSDQIFLLEKQVQILKVRFAQQQEKIQTWKKEKEENLQVQGTSYTWLHLQKKLQDRTIILELENEQIKKLEEIYKSFYQTQPLVQSPEYLGKILEVREQTWKILNSNQHSKYLETLQKAPQDF